MDETENEWQNRILTETRNFYADKKQNTAKYKRFKTNMRLGNLKTTRKQEVKRMKNRKGQDIKNRTGKN